MWVLYRAIDGAFNRCAHSSLKQARHFSARPNKKIGVVGCPFSKGQRIRGTELAPKVIRQAGLLFQIHNFDETLDIQDYGDVDVAYRRFSPNFPKNMLNYGQTVGTVKNLAVKVEEILQDGRMVITLGGDHSIVIGSIAAHLKYNKDMAVVWVDAHADINTNYTSNTGNMHGMPVGILATELENYWPELPGMEWLQNKLSLKDIVYIGLRSVDPFEKLIASKFNLHVYGMEDIDKYGIHNVIQRALKDVDPENKKGFHVSYDIDSLDVLEAPSTGTTVRGGLTLREGVCIMEEIYKTGRLQALDLVEVNPEIGSADDVRKTVDAAIHIIKAACGSIRSGKVPLDIQDIPKPGK